jgi:hypothetical protein
MRNELAFNKRLPDYDTAFLLILTRMCAWIKAIFSYFPYCALDLLISAEGLVCWDNIKCLRVLTLWNPPDLYTLKWNVDGSSKGKLGPAGIGGVLRDHNGIVMGFFFPVFIGKEVKRG